MNLDEWPYPKAPLVPLAETVHERASVEIFRGCTRGCRFCQAGMITRPVRERSITGIAEMVENGLASGQGDPSLVPIGEGFKVLPRVKARPEEAPQPKRAKKKQETLGPVGTVVMWVVILAAIWYFAKS